MNSESLYTPLVKPADLRSTPQWIKSFTRVARWLMAVFVVWGLGLGAHLFPRPHIPIWSYAAAAILLFLSNFIASVVPAFCWFRALRRRSSGRCGLCGYDRSGTAFDAVCSECGTSPRYPLRDRAET